MLARTRRVLRLAVFTGILIAPNSVLATESEPWWKNVQGQITIGKKEFLLGEPIYIRVAVANNHSQTLHFGYPVHQNFEFSAKDGSGKLKLVKKPKNPSMSVFGRAVPISPGTTFEDLAFVNEYLDFPGPGTYSVACDGYILVQKGLAKDRDMDERYISLKGAVTVKLRRGSVAEQEVVLRKLLTQLKSDDRRLQTQAAHAFTVSEPALAVKLLKETLMEKATPGRARPYASRATWAIARIGTDDATLALSNVALDSKSNEARMAALIEIGRSRVRKSVRALIQALSDPSPNIRVAALNALGRIGDKSSIPEVEIRLNDPNERVRDAARTVVQKLLSEGTDRTDKQTDQQD